MALEITLKQYKDWSTTKEKRRVAGEFSVELEYKIFGDRINNLPERLSKESQEEFQRNYAEFRRLADEKYEQIGLNRDEEINVIEIHESSRMHSGHFYIGSVRSGYNQFGFDTVLRTLIGKGLSDIYDIQILDKWYSAVFPDWNALLKRALDIHVEFAAAVEKADDCYVRTVFITKPQSNVASALDYFLELRDSERPGWPGGVYWGGPGRSNVPYNNREAEVYIPSSLNVQAIMTGMAINHGLEEEPTPAMFVVFKEPGFYQYYLDGLDIIEETARWVLEQDDPSQFAFEWSP